MYLQKRVLSKQGIPVWNELPKIVREAGTLNGFMAGLDRVDLFITILFTKIFYIWISIEIIFYKCLYITIDLYCYYY